MPLVPRRSAFGSSATGWKSVGRNVGKCTLASLSVDDVLDEFLGKCSDVEVVTSSTPENAGISHPAQTFVALWTVSGDAQEIAALPPNANRPHLVDQVAGSFQLRDGIAAYAADDFSSDRVKAAELRDSRSSRRSENREK